MVKTLLCQPIATEQSPQKTPPLGIMFAGAAAEAAGFEVEYWDERWDSQKKLAQLIKWSDVVGVSSFTGIQLKYAARILKRAKAAKKITLFGGIHANLTSDQCLAEDYIDYVAIGEGEVTLPSFLQYISSQTLCPVGIKTKNQSFDYRVADKLAPEKLISPITDKTMRFFELSNRTNDVMMPSSRGCPYSCGFCVNSTVKEKKYRTVDVDVWAGWLDSLLEWMDIKWLQVGDDYLGNQERILKIGEILYERNIKWHPSFRADNFKKDGLSFARKLADLGVTDVAIGVETGSDRLMSLINKAETKEDILQAARCLFAANIRPRYYFIVGFPTETRQEMLETLDFADQLCRIHKGNCNMPIYNFTPFPGIALFEEAKKSGMRIPETMSEWERYTICNSGTKEMQNLYYIGGLHFHQQPGSKTDMNFPGWRRMLIRPFEAISDFRWRKRFFKAYGLEKFLVELVLKYGRKR